MKKWLSIFFICLSVTVLSGITYAWFIPNNQANGIDGYTDGIVFEYELSNSGSLIEEFDVTNLTFFDPNGHNNDSDEALYELEYFLESAIEVRLIITNTCRYDIELTVSQLNLGKTKPHVLCIFSETKITSIDAYSSIQDIIDKSVNSVTRLNTKSLSGNYSSKTIYMYIIGIQPDDNATDEFLDDTYSLEIEMKAVGVD